MATAIGKLQLLPNILPPPVYYILTKESASHAYSRHSTHGINTDPKVREATTQVTAHKGILRPTILPPVVLFTRQRWEMGLSNILSVSTLLRQGKRFCYKKKMKKKNSPPTFSIDGERISQNPSWSFTNINSP